LAQAFLLQSAPGSADCITAAGDHME